MCCGPTEETGIPYQSLINLYLVQCVKKKKRLPFVWLSSPPWHTKSPACALQAGLSMFSYVLVVPIRNQNSR